MEERGEADLKYVEQEKWEVRGSSVSDQPTASDSLGFAPYVQALSAFLLSSETTTPLTVAIEGGWGTGKTSFLLQLKDELQKAGTLKSGRASDPGAQISSQTGPVYAIWFNAWRHDQRDAVWATFALAFTKQLKDQLGFFDRLICDLKLLKSQIGSASAWIRILCESAFWWILILLLPLTSVLLSHTTLKSVQPFSPHPEHIFSELAAYSWTQLQLHHLFLSIAISSLAFVLWWTTTVRNPLDIDLKKYLTKPNYEGHSSFIESFHEDFQKLMAAYVGNGRVFAFIDDLDRCDDGRIVELFQAMNLMIGADGPIVFVVGMDKNRVAALIADSSKEPAERSAATKIPERGYAYLEKFVQIGFRLPRPNHLALENFFSNLNVGPPQPSSQFDLTKSTFHARQIRTVHASLEADSPKVRHLALLFSPLFDGNPRRLKQFVNTFRLQSYIAASVGLFDIEEKSGGKEASKRNSLTVEQVGKFVALSLRWPNLVTDLASHPDLLQQLVRFAEEKSTVASPNPAFDYWSACTELLILLSVCTIPPISDRSYSLKDVDLTGLLEITPIRNMVKLKPYVIRASPDSDLILGFGDTQDEAWADAAQKLPKER